MAHLVYEASASHVYEASAMIDAFIHAYQTVSLQQNRHLGMRSNYGHNQTVEQTPPTLTII